MIPQGTEITIHVQITLHRIQELHYTVEPQHKCDSHYWSLQYTHCQDTGHPQLPGRYMWFETSSSLFLSSKFILLFFQLLHSVLA